MSNTTFRWAVISLLALVAISVIGSAAFITLNNSGNVCRTLFREGSATPPRPQVSVDRVPHSAPSWETLQPTPPYPHQSIQHVTRVDGNWPSCQCAVFTQHQVKDHRTGEWQTDMKAYHRGAREYRCSEISYGQFTETKQPIQR